MTKRFSKNKILMLFLCLALMIVSFTLCFTIKPTLAYESKGEELRALFLEFLSDNGITSQQDIEKAQTNQIKMANGKTYVRQFIEDHVNDFGVLYENNGKSKDVLTDDGVKIVQQCFGINSVDFLMEGGSIANANGESFTGKFKSYSSEIIKAGGDSVGANDFSIVIMGDQQTAVEYHSKFVSSSYNWVANNASAMNLKAFISVGDIVDDCKFLSWRQPSGNPYLYVSYNSGRMGNWKQQLQFATNQANKLLNLGVPIALTMGNHDYEDMAESYRVKDSFNDYFNYSDYSSKSWFGTSLYNDLEAATYFFSAQSQDYMIITLGTYPTDEMLDWANEQVENNPTKKVIISTHGYIYGDEIDDLTVYGKRIWNNFISKHENIFLVLSGHECTKLGDVIKRVDFGDNGNAVTQLMINPQREEFGGAGIISQLIFREDGSVDHVYYSPYAEEINSNKGYFMSENQFSFNLDVKPLKISGAEEVVSYDGITNSSLKTSYFGNDTSSLWKNSVYSLYNVTATSSGLTTDSDGGYVIHKLLANDYSRFTLGSIAVYGHFTSDSGAYQVDVSSDGVNWTTAIYNNYDTGRFNHKFNIDDKVVGFEELYIKISFKGAIITKLDFTGDQVQTVILDASKKMTYTYENNLSSSSFASWDMKNAYSKYQAVLSGGRLGSGDPGKLTYKSFVEYRFDSGYTSRHINSIKANIVMSVINPERDAEGHAFYEKDTKYYLRYSISKDGGKTYSVVKEYLYQDLTYSANVATPNLNDTFSFAGQNVNSAIIKVEYFGAGCTFCNIGIDSLSFDLNYDCEYKEQKAEFDYNGGTYTSYLSDPLKDGYAFEGWHLGSVDGEKVNPLNYLNKPVKLVAKWNKVNRITYVLDGGTNSALNSDYVIENNTLTLYNPTKTGYSFVGWFTSDKVNVSSVKGGTSDIVLYAVWVK